MSASIVQLPSRGRYSCREQVSNEPATARGRALLAFTRSNSRTDINPARKVIVIAFPIPPQTSQAGNLAGEQAAVCANLAGLFLGQGRSRVLNFCRSFGCPATLLRALLNSVQEPSRRVVQAFKSFRGGWALRHVNKHDSGVTQDVGTIDQRRGFFSQGVGCV